MLHLYGRSRDEKGQSISVLFAISVVALLAVGGLVVDGGAHATATRKAQQAASSAARAAVDASAPARAAGVPIGLNEVVSAGNHALDVAGVEGTVHIEGQEARVTTTVRVRTVLLGIVGINHLTARGEARASLVTP